MEAEIDRLRVALDETETTVLTRDGEILSLKEELRRKVDVEA